MLPRRLALLKRSLRSALRRSKRVLDLGSLANRRSSLQLRRGFEDSSGDVFGRKVYVAVRGRFWRRRHQRRAKRNRHNFLTRSYKQDKVVIVPPKLNRREDFRWRISNNE